MSKKVLQAVKIMMVSFNLMYSGCFASNNQGLNIVLVKHWLFFFTILNI